MHRVFCGSTVALPTSSSRTTSNLNSYVELFQNSLGRQVIQQEWLFPLTLLLLWLHVLARLFLALDVNTRPQESHLCGVQLNDQKCIVHIALQARETWVLISSLVPSGN